MHDTVSFFETILRLKRLPRTGWLLAGVMFPESIADHSFGTAMVAYILTYMVNSAYEDSGHGDPIDVGKVARIALVHDLAESLVTDIPRQASDFIGTDVKHEAEHRAIDELLSAVIGGDELMTLWQEYESGATPEARIVRDADKLELVLQARHYASTGNANLNEFWEDHSWNFDKSRELFNYLLAERGDADLLDVTDSA